MAINDLESVKQTTEELSTDRGDAGTSRVE